MSEFASNKSEVGRNNEVHTDRISTESMEKLAPTGRNVSALRASPIKQLVKSVVLFGAITLACAITSPTVSAQVCPDSLPYAHLLGGFWTGLAEVNAVGITSALDDPSITNGSQDYLCRSNAELGCQVQAGGVSDWIITAQGNWGNPGVTGCPIDFFNAPDGAGPIVSFVTSSENEGSEAHTGTYLIVSVGYSAAFLGYAFDFAGPLDLAGNAGPLAAATIPLPAIMADVGPTTADVTISWVLPETHDDCANRHLIPTCPVVPTGGSRQVLTGYVIYRLDGLCGTAPLTSNLDTWLNGDPGRFLSAADPVLIPNPSSQSIELTVPYDPSGTSCSYFALGLNVNFFSGSHVSAHTTFGNVDIDGDWFMVSDDCDDANENTYPDAPQICDGLNNNCNDINWPTVPEDESDSDHDGFAVCEDDCEDSRPEVYPGATELCDGLDNDCDDLIDEEFVGQGEPCGVSDVGVCRLGVMECQDDTLTCVGNIDPTTEICDGLDNNCDGITDNNLGQTTCGVGECMRTVDNCIGGVPQTCVPAQPSAEVCDGLDNDCDWATDEIEDLGETTCGLGVCLHTTPNCVNGVQLMCDSFEGSSTEVCDGLDNDCDGQVDENLGLSICGIGACQRIVETCVGGVPVACIPGTPTPETCNCIDDDCDGLIDEELGPTCCFDSDGDGVSNCEGDCDDTRPDVYPAAHELICNDGLDNDCDGLVDDEDTEDCEPMLVVLSSFSASVDRSGVHLKWTTTLEVDTAGFRMLRARPGEEPTPINTSLIPALGDVFSTTDYEYLDTDWQRPGVVSYYLEDIEFGGRVARHGPLEVRIHHRIGTHEKKDNSVKN